MRAGLLIVSYHKDFPFYQACARSIAKNTSGFDFKKVMVPTQDVPLFTPDSQLAGIEVCGFDEEPGRGFLSHLRMKCYADHHFPQADVIFHIDSDSVFAFPSTPQDFMVGDKVQMLYRDFSTFLTSPIKPGEMESFMGFTGLKSDLDRGQYFWKFATDYALGFPVPRETMQGTPIGHIREVYSAMREAISRRFTEGFDAYLLSCRNEFPQTFCEFNSLGAIAFKFFEDRYHWRDIMTEGHPPVKAIQCWSHGGLDKSFQFAKEVGGLQTPRQLFERLGL